MADFVRLTSASTGRRRIAVGNIRKLFDDRRAKDIESVAEKSIVKVHPIFHAPFHYYLAPFALSSKLWQTRIDTPATLTTPDSPAPNVTPVFGLACALNRAYRPIRTSNWLFGKAINRIHAAMIEATGGPEVSKARRQGELMFSVGAAQVLSPAASDVPVLLRELTAALRHGQSTLPLTHRLYAAFEISLIHPFVDGNGRLMRAVAVSHDRTACRTGALCRAIAVFLQGRQKLWNFTLPLALRGDAVALWDHFARCVYASSRLLHSVDDAAQRYQLRWGVGRSDIRSSADALLIASAVLSDRQFSRLRQGSSSHIRRTAEQLFQPVLLNDKKFKWINSGAQQFVGETAGFF